MKLAIRVLALLGGMTVFGGDALAQTASATDAVTVDEVRALRARLRALEAAQKAEMERKKAEEEAGPKSVSLGGLPGTFEIPGTGLSMGFGGYIKADLIVSSFGTNNFGDQFIVPGLIPVDRNEAEENQLTFHARESRIWFKAYRPTDWGAFNAYLEIDFFAFQAEGNERVSNSFAPRLRHAYGTLGPLLVGQTWTTFMNASAIPDNLDFVGSVGTVFARQPMIRWTQKVAKGWAVVLAVESPESTFTTSTGSRLASGDEHAPDVILGVKASGSFGNVTLNFIGRQLRLDLRADDELLPGLPAAVQDSELGGGVSLAGRITVVGRDNVRFNVNAGSGIGRYIGLNVTNGGYLDENGNIDGTIPLVSGHIAYQHYWNDLFRSSATFSFVEIFNPDESSFPGSVTRTVLGGIVNLLFSPIPRTTFGIEYIYARRVLEDGNGGTLNRGQFSAKFVF